LKNDDDDDDDVGTGWNMMELNMMDFHDER
jgi:hypothetical protein